MVVSLRRHSVIATVLFCTMVFISTVFAQDSTTNDDAANAELAKKLQNPIASLVSAPLQNNWGLRFAITFLFPK